MSKPINKWIVRLAMGVLWALATCMWLGIFTILGLGFAEQHNFKVVPEIAVDYYERSE